MTRDDIVRMAREAGLQRIYSACDGADSSSYEDWDDELERFAALVAAAEREACAVAGAAAAMAGLGYDAVAAAIRARGEE